MKINELTNINICQGTVFHMHDLNMSNTKPHYYIVMNSKPENDSLLLLLIATSQIQKAQIRHRKMNEPPESLVIINEDNSRPFFKKKLLFNVGC